jgi:2-oxoglutarate ferredoxin oxidoreductase subunit delta
MTLFALLPWLRVWGRGRWRTYAGAAALGSAGGAAVLAALGFASAAHVGALALTCGAAMALLSVDLTGTTPWYPGGVNSVGNHLAIELVEDRCTGAAECVQVCPRDVLAMDGPRRKVRIARPDSCIRCAACIVQCPDDALRFRFTDGRVVEPATVRSTRVNLLGRRTLAVRAGTAGDDA